VLECKTTCRIYFFAAPTPEASLPSAVESTRWTRDWPVVVFGPLVLVLPGTHAEARLERACKHQRP